MRKIRLRGKRIKDGEWVVGEMSLTAVPCIMRVSENAWHAIEIGVPIPLMANTVTESTGFFDRNGKEIFEGDILEYWDTEANGDLTYHLVKKREAVNRDEYGCWMIGYAAKLGHYLQHDIGTLQMHLGIEGDRDSNGVLLADCTGVKVVGNVFDNPELMDK